MPLCLRWSHRDCHNGKKYNRTIPYFLIFDLIRNRPIALYRAIGKGKDTTYVLVEGVVFLFILLGNPQ